MSRPISAKQQHREFVDAFRTRALDTEGRTGKDAAQEPTNRSARKAILLAQLGGGSSNRHCAEPCHGKACSVLRAPCLVDNLTW